MCSLDALQTTWVLFYWVFVVFLSSFLLLLVFSLRVWEFSKTTLCVGLSGISLPAATAKSLQLCPTLWPHRRQPTRLPRPWDSPGKNTGVGCHFLLQCMKVKSESEVTQSCLILSDPMDCSPSGSSVHGIFQAEVLEWGAIAFSDPSLQL